MSLGAPASTPSPPPGAERAGVRWGIPERLPVPTSPSHAFGAGPSLSPLKGGEGLIGWRSSIGGLAKRKAAVQFGAHYARTPRHPSLPPTAAGSGRPRPAREGAGASPAPCAAAEPLPGAG